MKSERLKVKLSHDVYRSCLVHALSTEREEVMGLLIGEVISAKTDHDVTDVEIVAMKIMERSDKRKDRVEIRSFDFSFNIRDQPLKTLLATNLDFSSFKFLWDFIWSSSMWLEHRQFTD